MTAMTGVATAVDHEHAWARMQFELVDDRPMVSQVCEACGLVRRYRAWERYWTPGAGDTPRGSTDRPTR